MAAQVDRDAAAEQEFLRQLVETNSGTMNLAGVRAVGAMLEPRFRKLGFATRWVPMDEVHRAGHLVAEHPCPVAGKCGKRMLLIGHMDTVFDKDSPFQHWSVDGDTATGPGTNDMKGGIVIMLMALDAMQRSCGACCATQILPWCWTAMKRHMESPCRSRGESCWKRQRSRMWRWSLKERRD